TPALDYGRTFFSEPAGGLLLLAATILVLPREGENTLSLRRVLLAGGCLGAMVLFKPAFAIHIVPAGLTVLWLALFSQRAVHRPSFIVHPTQIKRALIAGAV